MRFSGDTSYHTPDAVLELAVLGGVDKRVDGVNFKSESSTWWIRYLIINRDPKANGYLYSSKPVNNVSKIDDERVDAAVAGYQSHGGVVEATEYVFVFENLRNKQQKKN